MNEIAPASLDLLLAASSLTASLHPEEVYARSGETLGHFSGASACAIYLFDPETHRAILAYAQGLSETFRLRHRAFEIDKEKLPSHRPTVVPDASRQPQSAWADSLAREGLVAYADLPLAASAGPIGVVTLFFSQPRLFLPDHVELWGHLAAQAGTAISNARTFARTELMLKRRSHKLEILEKIGRDLAAAVHSPILFEKILDFGLGFTNAPWGSLCTWDPETRRLQVNAARGYQVPEHNLSIAQRDPLQQDFTIWPEDFEQFESELTLIELSAGAARSALRVPLIYDDRVIGALTLESPEPNAFTTNDRAFISQLATQAAIAVENASLYKKLEKRLSDQGHLYTMSSELNTDLRVDSVIDHILQGIGRVLNASATGLYLWREGSHHYTLENNVRNEDSLEHRFSERIEYGQSELAGGSGSSSGELPPVDPPGGSTPGCHSCQVLLFPMKVRDRPIGMILVHVPIEANITEETLQLPRSMAAQGAMALQNALLFSNASKGRDQLEALLDSVDESVLMVNAEGEVVLANDRLQRLLGIPLAELQQKHFSKLPSAALEVLGLPESDGRDLAQLQTNDTWPASSRTQFTEASGLDNRAFERITAPVWGDDQEALGWVIVIRDISDAHRRNQAREFFTETLVHDLRSPAGAVSSALVVLDDYLIGGDASPIARQSVDIARRGTMRVLSLIESLLDLSRMESGVIDLHPEEFEIGRMVQEIMVEFEAQAADDGVKIQNLVPAAGPRVRADREQIGRVLANLLDNALKFTPEGGVIQIIIEPDPDPAQVRICVRDTGPGIPEAYRDSIFDRFSQIPGSRGRRRGTGIGLTFCRLIMEAQRGQIWVEPAPDAGSIFKFTLEAC